MSWEATFTSNGAAGVSYLPQFTGSVSRYISERLQEKISVRDFGAVGNGVADDSSAILKAVDYVSSRAQAYGAYLCFPQGIYRTKSPIVIAANGVYLIGEGMLGASSFSPMQWYGSMIYYDGKDGADVVKFNKGDAYGDILYGGGLSNIRIAATTSSPKSNALVFRNCSEQRISKLDLGGLANEIGMLLQEITLLYADEVYGTCETLVQTEVFGGYFNQNSRLYFSKFNPWLCKTGVKILGNTEFSCRDSFIENYENGISVEQQANANLNYKLILSNVKMQTDATYSQEPRAIKVLCQNTADYFTVSEKFVLDHCDFSTYGDGVDFSTAGDYCIELDKNGNTNGNTFSRLDIIGGTYKSQVAVVNSTMLSAPSVTGYVYSKNNSSVIIPIEAGTSKWNTMISKFGYWDMSAGYPMLLPQNINANTPEGQLSYNTTSHRMNVSNGTAADSIPIIYSGSATINFDEIAAGAIATSTITVTGAATGDPVFVGVPSAIDAGLIVFGYVSATNTVTLRVYNSTGGAINPASATWKASVVK